MRAARDVDAGHALEEGGGILLGLGVRCGHQQGCAGGGPARGLDGRAEQAVVTYALEAGRQVVLQDAGDEGGAIDEATNTTLMAELPPCTISVAAHSGHHGSTSPAPPRCRPPARRGFVRARHLARPLPTIPSNPDRLVSNQVMPGHPAARECRSAHACQPPPPSLHRHRAPPPTCAPAACPPRPMPATSPTPRRA